MTNTEIIDTINANFATVAEFNEFLASGNKTIQLRKLENERDALQKQTEEQLAVREALIQSKNDEIAVLRDEIIDATTV